MSRMAMWFWLTLLILLVGVAVPSVAQEDADEHEEEEPKLVLRAYDIREQLVSVPNFEAPVPRLPFSQGGSSDGGIFGDSSGAEESESGDELLRSLIERMVRPEDPWESVGGRSTLDIYGGLGKMFVVTTEQGHRELKTLLDSARPNRTALMIEVQAMELDPAFTDEAGTNHRFLCATDAEKAALKKATRRILGTASLQLFDGQRSWYSTGRLRAYVADMEPVVAGGAGSDGGGQPVVAYDATVDHQVQGAVTDVKATLLNGGKEAVVVYRLRLSHSAEIEPAVINHRKHAVLPALSTITIDQCMGTTRIPVGASVLLAAGQHQPVNVEKGLPTSPVGVYFVLTVHVIGK